VSSDHCRPRTAAKQAKRMKAVITRKTAQMKKATTVSVSIVGMYERSVTDCGVVKQGMVALYVACGRGAGRRMGGWVGDRRGSSGVQRRFDENGKKAQAAPQSPLLPPPPPPHARHSKSQRR